MRQDAGRWWLIYLSASKTMLAMLLTAIRPLSILLLICCSFACNLSAQLKLANVFSNDMVLQRDQQVRIWGTAEKGTLVTLQFAGQSKQSTTGENGKWMIELSPMPVSAAAQEMQVYTGSEKITLTGILIGDVWLCSGQSNMEYPLDRKLKHYSGPKRGPDIAEQELAAMPGPAGIRYLYAERNLKKYPQFPGNGWFTNQDTTVRYVSTIGYFFAKEVYAATGVPIGIISSSWGGTRVEQWTPPGAYSISPTFRNLMTTDTFKIDDMKPGQMYRGMIEPLIPMAIKGILWYQGESNCMIEDQASYREKMIIMEEQWRKDFRNAALPFYTVQIAPYLYSARKDPKKHSEELLPLFWEAQTACTTIPHTYMVVTTDLVDNLKDIHPSYKWTIAHRLAKQVLQVEYGKTNNESFSPHFRSAKRKGNQLIISFGQLPDGFREPVGDSLSWFSVADQSGKFLPATASISGSKIIVSNASIRKPKYIRFGWNEKAMPNLFSREGLPIVPFRNDTF
jgi:sialate O-acetylesterase